MDIALKLMFHFAGRRTPNNKFARQLHQASLHQPVDHGIWLDAAGLLSWNGMACALASLWTLFVINMPDFVVDTTRLGGWCRVVGETPACKMKHQPQCKVQVPGGK